MDNVESKNIYEKTPEQQEIDRLLKLLQKELSFEVQAALLKFGSIAIPAYLEILEKSDDIWWMKRVDNILTRLGDQVVGPLIERLKKPVDSRSFIFASILGNIGSQQAVELLIAALKSEDSDLRREAATALGKIQDRRAVAPLIENLPDAIYDSFFATVSALGQLGDKTAFEPLVTMLATEKDVNRRVYIVNALGILGDARAIDPLKQILLHSSDNRLSFYTSKALANFGDSSGVKYLRMYLKHSDAGLQGQARNALAKLGLEK